MPQRSHVKNEEFNNDKNFYNNYNNNTDYCTKHYINDDSKPMQCR